MLGIQFSCDKKNDKRPKRKNYYSLYYLSNNMRQLSTIKAGNYHSSNLAINPTIA